MSRAAQYAIRTLIQLARLPPGAGSATVASIAEKEAIPPAFLAKVVRSLVRAGLIESSRGPGGGVRLARPPEEISVLQTIESAGDERYLELCMLGLPRCSDANPCAMHAFWSEARGRLRAELAEATIAAISGV
ncbi:MAG TPA: Rrf2 family transcriptional regulator [Thermoanaerobaculia bacterium]|nr:Rrf2 family transcriptional regulator [Thermoanaerobaculia bacterium]